MSFEYESLGPDRYLVWDLLRETDPYYLNHHLFDTDFTAIEADREGRRAAGRLDEASAWASEPERGSRPKDVP